MFKSITLASVCAGAVAIAGCATGSGYEASEAVVAELAKYEKTGTTDSCLPLRTIDTIKPIDDRNFLVKTRTGKLYLNELSSSCSGADRSQNRLQYTLSQSTLCQNEIIRVVDNLNGFTVGSCGLNRFQEVTRKTEVASK